jgi:hypothetical protein
MKNYAIRLQLVVLLIATFLMEARELRTPWTLTTWDGFIHYKEPRPKDDDTCWNVDWWGAGYFKTADKAYINKTSLETESLAGVWFGKENFVALDAFAPGSYDPQNPLLGVLEISPRFDFNENGVFLGMTVDRAYCCGRWHFGGRVRLAVRNIEVELDSCCDLSETIDDVRIVHNEQVQSNVTTGQSKNGSGLEVINNSYAYRLDLVAALPTTVNAPVQKLLLFNDLTATAHSGVNPITIGGTDVTVGGNDLIGGGSAVHVVKTAGSVGENCVPGLSFPNSPLALVNVPGTLNLGDEMNLPALNEGGTGSFALVQNNERSRFAPGTNYTPLGNDVATQRTLWVVPTAFNFPSPDLDTGTQTILQLSTGARQIQTDIENVLNDVNKSSIGFLESQCITFDTQRISGIADLDMWLYAQRMWCWGYWLFEVGMRFPTGKRLNHPNRVLLQVAPGNNGHFEMMLGSELGWEPCDWLNIELGGYFSHAFKTKEKVAAAFAGAIIKNIGPTVDAHVAWNYFDMNLDFTFRVPCNPRIGVTYGYELYVKGKDQVKFKTEKTADLFGVQQTLDPKVLELRSSVLSNRFRAEAFFQGDYGEIYGGWSRVFAGKNAMREAEYYLGFVAYF